VGDIEFIVLLLAVAALGVRFADHASIPYPIVLVVFGLAVGLLPGLPDLELDPDVIFLVFLPPLLFAAGWRASPRELRSEKRALAGLAVGLVLVTMVAVAVLAHAIVPGMSWAAAFVLGAVVAPTDPVSATATRKRAILPRPAWRNTANPASVVRSVRKSAQTNPANTATRTKTAISASGSNKMAMMIHFTMAGGLVLSLRFPCLGQGWRGGGDRLWSI